jgi:hypothetical protein
VVIDNERGAGTCFSLLCRSCRHSFRAKLYKRARTFALND